MLTPVWSNIFQKLDLPLDWLTWLANPDSLTRALEEASLASCRVNVQQEGWGLPWQDEAEFLDTSRQAVKECWIREVVLSTHQPAVFARSIFPPSLLERLPDIARLGNQPLGHQLFADNFFQRQPIEVAEITSQHLLWQSMPEKLRLSSYWARRSLFNSDAGSLLISEVFLPYVITF